MDFRYRNAFSAVQFPYSIQFCYVLAGVYGNVLFIFKTYRPHPFPCCLTCAVPSTCSNGLDGYQDGNICCKLACGLCGGVGCGRVNGTAGASDCCPSTIAQNNQICGGQVVAPCVIPGKRLWGIFGLYYDIIQLL